MRIDLYVDLCYTIRGEEGIAIRFRVASIEGGRATSGDARKMAVDDGKVWGWGGGSPPNVAGRNGRYASMRPVFGDVAMLAG